MEAGLKHPIFDPLRPWLERGGGSASLALLNSFAEERGLRTEGGKPVRFVPPAAADPYYEIQVFETGRVPTRLENRHDLFNALAWLAFPQAKARLNARHAAEIPREREQGGGRRGRVRDALTIFDEGGAIVACDDAELIGLLREGRWKALFSDNRERVLGRMRIAVVGHAVMEQALRPYPGITCKAVLADPARDLDAQAAAALALVRSPRELPPVPVLGYPGWFQGSGAPGFYDDARYFRPSGQAGGKATITTAAPR